MSDELWRMPAVEAVARLRKGEISPLELVEASARLHRPVWLDALRQHGVAEQQAQSICDAIALNVPLLSNELNGSLLSNSTSPLLRAPILPPQKE